MKYYRKQESVIEKGKIAKMLIAAQMGQLHNQKGKSLETLDIPNYEEIQAPTDAPPVEIESDGSNECSEDEEEARVSQEEDDTASTKKKSGRPKGLSNKREKRSARPFSAKVSEEEREQILLFFQEEVQDLKNINQKLALSYIKAKKSKLDWLQVKSVVSNRIAALKHGRE